MNLSFSNVCLLLLLNAAIVSIARSSTSYVTSVTSIQGRRDYQEDEVAVSGAQGFAAVYDGHGGGHVSTYLRKNYFPSFLRRMGAQESDKLVDTSKWEKDKIQSAMMLSLKSVDEEVGQIEKWRNIGSTCTAVCVNNGNLYSINCGDSRAVLSRNGKALALTHDHKPNEELERGRIEGLGGEIKWFGLTIKNKPAGRGCYRVNGNLALSRAVGDWAERPYVSSESEMDCIKLTKEDKFVIVASDGLWDVMESEEAVSLVNRLISQPNSKFFSCVSTSSPLISSALVSEALRRGSSDNISVCVLFL